MITAFSIGCFANLGKMVTMVTIIQKVEEAWNLAPQKLYSLLYITDPHKLLSCTEAVFTAKY